MGTPRAPAPRPVLLPDYVRKPDPRGLKPPKAKTLPHLFRALTKVAGFVSVPSYRTGFGGGWGGGRARAGGGGGVSGGGWGRLIRGFGVLSSSESSSKRGGSWPLRRRMEGGSGRVG